MAALARIALLAVVTIACVEGAAYAFLQLRATGDDARGDARASLTARADDAGAAVGAPRPEWMREHVLHPYLGFVRNPAFPDPRFNGLPVEAGVNAFGFFGDAPVIGDDDPRFVVGLFGGSVAAELFLMGEEAFIDTLLEARPELRERGVKLVSVALGGMKQPQQLLAFSYLRALGARFDAVVNLDGFNEVVLPFAENRPMGVHPAHPRSWRVYAQGVPDGETLALLGERAEAQASLAAWQRRLDRFPWSSSNLGLALWDALLQRSEAQQSAAERGLRERMEASGPTSFQQSGPPLPGGQGVDAVLSEAAAIWERSSRALGEACRSAGVPYLHVLQPNQYVRDSRNFTIEERLRAVAPATYPYRQGVELGYPKLQVRLGTLGRAVPVFDATAIFRDDPEPIWRDTCCHANERGYRILAAAIAERLGRELARASGS